MAEKGPQWDMDVIKGEVGRIAGGNNSSLSKFSEVKDMNKTERLSTLCKKLTHLYSLTFMNTLLPETFPSSPDRLF